MRRDKRNQNSGDILSAFPDWGLKRAGNTEKALKMSHSVSCHYMLCEILQAASLSWGLEGGENRWNADVDNSCWRIVHHKVFLPRTAAAHVFVRQRARGACSEDFLQDEDTPAVVKQVLAVPDTSWPVPCGGSAGGGGAYCAKSCWTCKTLAELSRNKVTCCSDWCNVCSSPCVKVTKFRSRLNVWCFTASPRSDMFFFPFAESEKTRQRLNPSMS